MYNWKAINRKIREKIASDGYEYLGDNSISYDNNYSIIMYSSTANDIYVKLKEENTNQIALCLDINASEKNKKRFGSLIKTLKTNSEYTNTLEENETNDGKEVILHETKDKDEDFYIEKTAYIFETCWPILLEIKQEEKEKRIVVIQEENKCVTEAVKTTKIASSEDETPCEPEKKLSIRLINKELNKNGANMLFELSDNDEHKLEIAIQRNNSNDIVLIKATKQLEYYVELDESKTKFIISENKQKLYQTFLVGSIKSHLTIAKEEKNEPIREENEILPDNKQIIKGFTAEELKKKEPIQMPIDIEINLSEISNHALNFFR